MDTSRKIMSVFALLALACGTAWAGRTSFVNTFVGTGGHGHTFPGAAYPFGMVQLSPDTRPTPSDWDGCSGYHYSDQYIYGFSHTHLSGTGCDDLCDVLLMPVTGFSRVPGGDEYRSAFSHGRETSSPGFYSVFLDTPSVLADMTVGRRFGVHRYTYASDSRQLVIDLKHRDFLQGARLVQKDAFTVEGYRISRSWADRQHVHFYIVFDTPIKSFVKEGEEAALIEFGGDGRSVCAYVGISSVSEENARMNLADGLGVRELRPASLPSFELVKSLAEKEWEKYLSKIQVKSDSESELRTFYTALYHTAIHPSLYSDACGEYLGMDRKVHKADFDRYTVFSIWDTFRALHPLFCIIERERTVDFIKSFMSIYEEAGKLPVWELCGHETNCMIGYNSVSVIADAYAKGIRGVDPEALLEAMESTSRRHDFGLDSFYADGAVLAGKEHESVSKTLEYAYDAWCVSTFARSLGMDDIADEYLGYAQNWRGVADPATGFMRARLNGRWLSPFDPSEVNNHYTEANSWQYSFFVPQDVEGHIAFLGGEDSYAARLDALFTAPEKTTGRTQADITGLIGQYAHGNEPSHHIPYLYNYAGRPWKTQERVREILSTLYDDSPEGLCGNEDCGQMSAWYVMSSLGLYSVCPGTPELCVTSPLFSEAVIRLESGKRFRISTAGDGKYIKSAAMNRKALLRSCVDCNEILRGGSLQYVLSDEPSPEFGVSYENRPHSSIPHTVVASPAFEMENDIFLGTAKVSVSGTPEGGYTEIAEVKEGAEPEFMRYEGPFTVNATTVFAARNCLGGKYSPVVLTSLHRVHNDRTVDIRSRYNPQYSAGGDNGLIDDVRGTVNWRAGAWQGYQDTDFVAVVDLLSDRKPGRVGAGFCQDVRSWIWMPRYVEFFAAPDGSDPADDSAFVSLGTVVNTVGEQDYDIQTRDFLLDVGGSTPFRYLKVVAKNFGTIPQWHLGRGGEGFIFVDEILID